MAVRQARSKGLDPEKPMMGYWNASLCGTGVNGEMHGVTSLRYFR